MWQIIVAVIVGYCVGRAIMDKPGKVSQIASGLLWACKMIGLALAAVLLACVLFGAYAYLCPSARGAGVLIRHRGGWRCVKITTRPRKKRKTKRVKFTVKYIGVLVKHNGRWRCVRVKVRCR